MKFVPFCFCALLFLSGCGGGNPIPFNEQAFEPVIKDWIKVGAKKGYKMPMTPQQQVETLREAFDKNGYSLSATLHKLSEDGFSPLDFDMKIAGLLMIPSQELNEEELKTLYTDQELEDIEKIKKI